MLLFATSFLLSNKIIIFGNILTRKSSFTKKIIIIQILNSKFSYSYWFIMLKLILLKILKLEYSSRFEIIRVSLIFHMHAIMFLNLQCYSHVIHMLYIFWLGRIPLVFSQMVTTSKMISKQNLHISMNFDKESSSLI